MINLNALRESAQARIDRGKPKIKLDAVIVDINNLLYRIGHMERCMVDLAVLSTLEKLVAMREWYGASSLHVVWEGPPNSSDGDSNWRLAHLPTYKAGREDSELRQMVRLVETSLREILQYTNFESWHAVAGEGDDGFGTLANHLLSGIGTRRPNEPFHGWLYKREPVSSVGIYSADRDLWQLARRGLVLLVPQRQESDAIETHESVSEKLGGLRPDQIPDLKGLEGDPGDNIPGVKGVGKKNALALIQKHGSLERVIELVLSSEVDRLYVNGGFTTFAETAAEHKARVREVMGCTLSKVHAIRDGVESARVSKLVGGIKQDCEMVHYETKIDPAWLRARLVELGATDYLIEKFEGYART
jgi:hypothetical protein